MSKIPGRVALFSLILLMIWGPLFFLSHVIGLGEAHVLIASLASVLICFLIFFEEAREFMGRLTSVKIGDVELQFRKAVKKSIEDELASVVGITLDDREIHEKAGVNQLGQLMREYMARPRKKLVLRVQVRDDPTVDLTMLYFQVRFLDEYFNLRAILFVEGDQLRSASNLLGTVTPNRMLGALDDANRTLSRAFVRSVPSALISQIPYGPPLDQFWQEFSSYIDGYDQPRGLSQAVYRQIIDPLVELHILRYPLDEGELPKFLAQLMSDTHHVVLVQDGDIVTVRTIDKISREISIAALRLILGFGETEE